MRTFPRGSGHGEWIPATPGDAPKVAVACPLCGARQYLRSNEIVDTGRLFFECVCGFADEVGLKGWKPPVDTGAEKESP